MILCEGTVQEKSRGLYCLLQDNVQGSISAGDKDLHDVFENIVKFSTVMLYQYLIALQNLEVTEFFTVDGFRITQKPKGTTTAAEQLQEYVDQIS